MAVLCCSTVYYCTTLLYHCCTTTIDYCCSVPDTILPLILLYCTAVVPLLLLYCTVLYCTVLYCTVLCCTVPHVSVRYGTVLYCTVLYCTVQLCSAVLDCTDTLYCCPVVYQVLMYCTVLCAVLYCTTIQQLTLPWFHQHSKLGLPILPVCPFSTCVIPGVLHQHPEGEPCILYHTVRALTSIPRSRIVEKMSDALDVNLRHPNAHSTWRMSE